MRSGSSNNEYVDCSREGEIRQNYYVKSCKLWQNGGMGKPDKVDTANVDAIGVVESDASTNDKLLGLMAGEVGFFGLLNVMNLATQYSERIFNATQAILGSRLTEILRYQGGDAGMIPFGLSLFSMVMYAKYSERSNGEVGKGGETAANWLALSGMASSGLMALEEFSRIGLPSILARESGDLSVMAFAQTLNGDMSDVLVYGIPLIAGGIFFTKRIIDAARGRKISG